MAEPADRITEIRQRRIPLGPDAIWTLTRDRDALLTEVDRLRVEVEGRGRDLADWQCIAGEHQRQMVDAQAERDRLRARVSDLTALLNDPDRLAEHASELRSILSGAELAAEADRRATGDDL